MFECKVDAEQFKNLISMPTALIEECDITLGTSGIRVNTMDPAHVALCRIELAKSMFEEYACDKDTKIRLAINSKGTYGNGSSLVGQFPNKIKASLMDIKLRGETEFEKSRLELSFLGNLRKNAKIPLLEASEEEPPYPKIRFNANVKIVLADLLEVFKDMEKHGDNFRLTATREEFKIETVTELTEQVYPFEKGSDVMLELDVREPSKATFNLKYMLDILKQLKTAFEIVTLEWSTNLPLKISGENIQGATVEYFLAPRIEDHDEPIERKPEPKPETELIQEEDKIVCTNIVTN
ncbi:MAG: polymerase sliding clamp protein [Candidatus Woesebacteria bacterium GW2011_GWB1_39_12]|uniref:Polymerase sliding clamp protein n=1 Tax=Candidatus Woesebacteria bacterium GW2011_GWB1_39_12 TaxID=1618574 RepID=A0A0G0PTW0_9BACT|nr:MAG: polymerase sliding clamp protein [Candidatus Woesebacteria bacterium GW2011_GWB1_39_12]